MVFVDIGCFCHETETLLAVLLDVFLGTRPDQVHLEIGIAVLSSGGPGWAAASAQKPVVDIIVVQVGEAAKVGRESGQVLGGVGEGRAREDEDGWIGFDTTVKSDTAPTVVCSVSLAVHVPTSLYGVRM